MDSRLKEYNDKMNKSIDALKEEYASIRAGRANPRILDKVTVDYYGQASPIQNIANISIPEASYSDTTLGIKVYKDIESNSSI